MRVREVKGPLRPDPPEEARLEDESRVRSNVFSVKELCLLMFLFLKLFLIRFRPRSLWKLDTDPDLLPPVSFYISCISDISRGESNGVSLGEAIGDNIVDEFKDPAREFR